MTDPVDYSQYTEAELLDVLRHINKLRSGTNFERFCAALEARGYAVTVSDLGFARAQLRADTPRIAFSASVQFSTRRGPLTWMEPSRNDFHLLGTGRIEVDNAVVRLMARTFGFGFGFLAPRTFTVDRELVGNVEQQDRSVRFEYRSRSGSIRAVLFDLPSADLARQLVALLPTQRSPDFRPQLDEISTFERQLESRSERTPVTTALVAINVLVFVAMWAAGAALFSPDGTLHIRWGSNFSAYTTDGEWWRLLTAAFLHFGLLHLIFNLWLLAATGPMVERLYGSVAFASIYLVACVAASLASAAWQPAGNSAGASGAIFGIYGALLAAMFRGRNTIPRGVLTPLRRSVIIFTLYALTLGFIAKGVDNGAHVGGLAAGLIFGGVLARAHIARTPPTTVRLLVATGLACVALVWGGFAVFSLHERTMEGSTLFWRTQHWMSRHERELAVSLNAMSKTTAGQSNAQRDSTFAAIVESAALPFWTEAERRMRKIQLPAESPLANRLEYLREITASRRSAYEWCLSAARRHADEAASRCVSGLSHGDELVRKYAATLPSAARGAGSAER